MKKKLLAILMATVMSMSLIACGGGEESARGEATVEVEESAEVEEEATEEVAGDYTEEQLAFVDEFNTMVDEYNAAIDKFNATPELSENQELVDIMNTLTEAINDVTEICNDPSLLTDENMELLRTTSFVETYKLIDEINAYESGAESGEVSDKDALASLFTMAGCGADEADNTYYFLCDDEITVAAFVILSADTTQSANVVGQVTDNGDGSLTVTGEGGEYITFMVEEVEDGLLLTLEDGTVVTLVPWDINEAIDFVLAIDEGTEIVG